MKGAFHTVDKWKGKLCVLEDGTSFLVHKAAISCLPGRVD
jgi:hypothetical protein